MTNGKNVAGTTGMEVSGVNLEESGKEVVSMSAETKNQENQEEIEKIRSMLKKTILLDGGELHISPSGRLYIVTWQGFDNEELDDVYTVTEINRKNEILGIVIKELCGYGFHSALPRMIKDYEK